MQAPGITVLRIILQRRLYYTHFTDKETEALSPQEARRKSQNLALVPPKSFLLFCDAGDQRSGKSVVYSIL